MKTLFLYCLILSCSRQRSGTWQSPMPGRSVEDIPLSDMLATAAQLEASYRPPVLVQDEELRRRGEAIEHRMLADGWIPSPAAVEQWMGFEVDEFGGP